MISDNFFDYTKINDSILLEKIFDGHSDLLAIESLNYSINTLKKKDFKFLINKKNETTSILKKSLKELNLLDDFSLFRENHSSIFNIKLNQKQFKFLINNNVRCVKRGSGVRVSVHFYNSIEDIKSCISLLKLLN